MDNEWQQSFDSIKTKHDLAYKTIVVAKRYDTAANHELAIVNYKISIKLIDDALLTPVALPDDPSALENDQSWSIALEMIKKMKRTRAELMQRIGHLSQQSNQTIEDEIEVNDFDGDTVAVDAQQRPRTFMELAEALQNLEYNSAVLPNVLELLFSCDGVILYHINANGDVSTTDESSTLRIVRLDQDLKQNFEATYFMQIIRSSAVEQIKQQLPLADSEQEEKKDDDQCVTVTAQASSENASQSSELTDGREVSSIIYPLVAGVSPCFRTDFGAFIFPDLEAEVPGSAFGFVITSGHDEIVLEVLEAILHGVVRQGQAPAADEEEEYEGEGRARQVRQSSEVISENIIKGACIISNGLVKGSEQVGKFVSFTTPYIISKMNKAPPTTVPSKVVGGVEIAKSATSKAVSVTGYVAGKVGTATMALGRFLAPHVHCQGSKLLSSAMGISNDEAANKVGGVLTVAAGAVEGFGTIYSGLETSATILGRNLSSNSVKIIEYRYGPSAGNVAADTLDTVGNVINLSQNVNYMTPRGLAKRTVKGTGKAIFSDFKPKTSNYVSAGALYPDLTEFTKQVANPKF